MSPILWIFLTAYLLVWLVMVGGLLEVAKRAREAGTEIKRPVWLGAIIMLAWPIGTALELGKRIGKSTDLDP